MARHWITLALVVLLAAGLFVGDVFLLPDVTLPGPPYFVPIIVGAYFLSPRAAAGVASGIVALRALSDVAKGTPIWLSILYFAALVIVSYLSILLSAKTRRQAALAEACERLNKNIERSAEVAQRRAAQLQAVTNNMVDVVFVSDPEGRIILANEAGRRFLGMDGIEAGQLTLEELPALLRMRHLNRTAVGTQELPLVRALAGETVLMEDEIVYSPSSKRDIYVRITAAPIVDETGKTVGAVEVARDVSEVMEFDRLKDQFISVAAHELKTPVAIMKAYAQALLRKFEGIPEPHRKMLEAIDRGADRIDRIVKDLLDISRLHLGHLEFSLERIDLPELVDEVIDRLDLTTGKHRIRLLKAEPVVVQGDRDRLEQVLINLIDNAIKYSPKGGDIDVAVDSREGEAVVSVSDHGIGVPKERQKRIFERFYRAHTGTPNDYGGMGVGLFISKQIIGQHGGGMWFESEEGQGSTFYFNLSMRGERAATERQNHLSGG